MGSNKLQRSKKKKKLKRSQMQIGFSRGCAGSQHKLESQSGWGHCSWKASEKEAVKKKLLSVGEFWDSLVKVRQDQQ